MPIRRTATVLLLVLAGSALRSTGAAQTSARQQAPPTFRSAVDLLTIEASVRDKGGAPVPDLQAADFTVTIDGKPRTVVSAQFFKSESSGPRLAAGAPPTPRHVTNDAAGPARVVVFAVDGESIRIGQEKALFQTASRMLDRLSPADAVGLIEMPGPSIDVTRDHAAVAGALQRFSGRKPPDVSLLAITYSEAESVERGDTTTIGMLVSHACSSELPCSTPSERASARNQVTGAAKQILQEERAHTRQTLSALMQLLRQMAVVRAPRSIVLVSGGLAFDFELMSEYKALERAAAESRVVLYSVRLDQMDMDMSSNKPGGGVTGDPALATGLANIGSMTGGMFFNGIGRAAGVFERIASEVSSFYELGLESSPADGDGKEHTIRVKVARAGLDVRAPSHVAVARPSKPAAPDPLAAALQQPTDVADVPLAVSTYSMQGAGDAVRLLVSAEIGAPKSAAAAEWGLTVTQKGKNIVKTRGRIPAGSESPRIVSTSVEVPPGNYQLRVAAVDAEDRAGVLEIPITAGYQEAGASRFGDLVVGVAEKGELEPRRRIEQAEDLMAMIEAVAGAPADLRGTLQLVRGGTARSVVTVPLVIRPPASDGAPAILQAHVPLGAVPPGRYTASVALESGGQPLTRIGRVLDVTESAAIAQLEPAAEPVAAASPAPLPPSSPADDVMQRVGGYVEHYGDQASLLVAIEHYEQAVTVARVLMGQSRVRGGVTTSPVGVATASGEKRKLVSEFALVPNRTASGGWLGYRDVIEVNGKPIADRHDRLQAIFQSGAPDLEEARRIADESARYNIGPVSRNFNVPTATLFFFHPGNLSRFTFRRRGAERIDGIETVVVEFRETRMPTLIMNASGKDVPSSGTLWMNPADGAVVRTRIELNGFRGSGSHAEIDVTYRKDAAVGLWVPSRMVERYSGGTAGAATTAATYTDFKRFQTSVKIK